MTSLRREIDALRSTLGRVWGALVDIDDASLVEEAIDAVDEACEVMSADWPEDFRITDEVSSKVQQQINLEEQLNTLAKEAEQTSDWNRRAAFFRKALAIGADVDEQYIEQQIEQFPPQEYSDLARRFLWLIGSITAKTPIDFKEEGDKLITTLKEIKKEFPRRHGPQASPVISEAMRIRDTEKKPYKEIYERLFPKYGEEMRNLTPVTLSDRVRSRRSRLRRSKKHD
jgi:hypothetical protein